MSRFTALRIENWRNFVKLDVDLQQRIFLVGPNAAGKSNFLDIFRFLHDIASPGGGLQHSVDRRGGVSSVRSLAARRSSDVLVGVQVETGRDEPVWRYELQFSQDSRRRATIKREQVWRDGEEILGRPDEDDGDDPERLTQTYLEQVNVNRPFRELAELFASVRYLHIVPQLVREPDRSLGRKNDPYGGDFLEQIAATHERTRNARLRRIKDALRVAVPQLTEIELWRDAIGTPHLRGRYEHWRPHGAWQSEEQFSDGTLRLLGLLWATQDGAGPLMLEEPELSLHLEIVRFLARMFARSQRKTGRQIAISTHSPDLLRADGIGLDEVLLLIPESEGTSVRRAADFEEVELLVRRGVSLADAVLPLTHRVDTDQLPLFSEM